VIELEALNRATWKQQRQMPKETRFPTFVDAVGFGPTQHTTQHRMWLHKNILKTSLSASYDAKPNPFLSSSTMSYSPSDSFLFHL